MSDATRYAASACVLVAGLAGLSLAYDSGTGGREFSTGQRVFDSFDLRGDVWIVDGYLDWKRPLYRLRHSRSGAESYASPEHLRLVMPAGDRTAM